MEILTGQRNFGSTLAEHAQGKLVRLLASQLGVKVPPLTEIADAPALKARINHNRWIVDCPNCAGAEFAWPGEPLFMCLSCFNAHVGGKWLRVTVPVNRLSIERILRVRPDPRTRNWLPGETLTKLKVENRERGLPEEAI